MRRKAYASGLSGRVREALEETGLSPAAVEKFSRKSSSDEGYISHTTVRRMLDGQPPSSDLIVTFAQAVGEGGEWDEEQVVRFTNELLHLAESKLRFQPTEKTTGKKGQRGTVRNGDGFGAFRHQTNVLVGV